MIGQIITSINYTAKRLFHFSPDLVQKAAENFLASGIAEIEIPRDVIDPEGRNENGFDEKALKAAVAGLPPETRVVSTYLGGEGLGRDNAAWLESQKHSLRILTEYFPDMKFAMLHPGESDFGDTSSIRSIVKVYAELADYASSLRDGFQLCFHNHFDSSGESAEQVRTYLLEIAGADNPALHWGPDTAHCDGMGPGFLEILDEFARLIGGSFHIKARVPAFDRLHGGEDYRKDRDIWSNDADPDSGLYGGAVNVADPESITPFTEIFKIIREKAQTSNGVVFAALEIDNPRQHPLLEVMCGALYLKNVHGIESSMALSNDEIIARVFKNRLIDPRNSKRTPIISIDKLYIDINKSPH